jgi:hypothetical protein
VACYPTISPNWVYVPVYDGVAGIYSLALRLEPNYGQCDRTAEIDVNSGKDHIIFTVTQRGITMDGNPLDKKYDVYLAGFYSNTAADYEKRGYWKNGEKIFIPDDGSVAGLDVLGNDVYVSGAILEADNRSRAVYWKNGEIVKLPKTLKDSYSTAITVAQNPDLGGKPIVYVAGYETGDDGINHPQYWKDGVVYQFTVPDTYPDAFDVGYGPMYPKISEAEIADIVVHGSDVHVIGNAEISDKFTLQSLAWYWKNGVRTDLLRNDDYGVQANDLAVAPNGDVYIAGFRYSARQWMGVSGSAYTYDKLEAVLWKNGVPQKLEDNAMAQSVFIDGDDIYVAVGKRGSGEAYYYKNGQKVSVGSVGNIATAFMCARYGRNALTVVDGDVYVMAYGDYYTSGLYGDLYSNLSFWKNRVKYDLPAIERGSYMAIGDLIVVPHNPSRKW